VILALPLRRQARRNNLSRRIEQHIRSGVGLYGDEWVLDRLPATTDDLTALSQTVISWVVETMAVTRRPYGIDQMALALAVAHPGSEPLASTAINIFRPVEFYQPGGQRERIESFLLGLDPELLNRAGTPVRVAVTLFSWGDVARAALPNE
jgi:hypothetical protein